MKPGDYRGKDGRLYRWDRQDGHVRHVRQYSAESDDYAEQDMQVQDWPAAKAALDALLAEPEWVEFYVGDMGEDTKYRYKNSGALQYDSALYGGWRDVAPGVRDIFRKGLEVGAAKERKKAMDTFKRSTKALDHLLSVMEQGGREEKALADLRTARDDLERMP